MSGGGIKVKDFVFSLAGFRRSANKAWSMPWQGRLIAALILIGALISLTDLLAVAARSAVKEKDAGWLWGAQLISPSNNSAAALSGIRPTSLHLLIKITGDELTAQYRVTASSGNALIAQALAAENAETSDVIVSDLLGQVSVAEFRDGITGNHYQWSNLEFQAPQLQVTGSSTTVTITSTQFRLLLDQQYISVVPPATSTEDIPVYLDVMDSSGVQVLDITGASLTSTAKGDTDLLRGSSATTMELREPGRNWTTGLRSIGGIALPVLGNSLRRLGSIFVYIVLLWSLTKASKDFGQRDDVAVSRNAVCTIVAAFTALSILEFCYQLIFEILPSPNLRSPALAGPVGLLVAGAVVMWPAACWRVTPAKDRDKPEHPWLKLASMLLTALAYLIILDVWLGLSVLTDWPVLLIRQL